MIPLTNRDLLSLKSLNPRRILIIKPSAIGDVVHSLPVLNLMRLRWPTAHIAWMLTPQCAGLLEDHPQLDEIILFRRRQLGRSWRNPHATLGLYKFTSSLRKRQFDLVIDLQGLFRSGYLSWRTGAAVRVGFDEAREGSRFFYTHVIPNPTAQTSRTGRRHVVERYLDLAEAIGCGRYPVKFTLPIGHAEQKWIAEKVAAFSPFALLIPGSIWPTKCWPVEHFAALGKILRERHGLKIIAAGSPDESARGQAVNPDVNLAGETSLRQLTALIATAQIVVANDSGPMHIAAALDKPLITPFGPTNPVLTGPYGRLDAAVRLDIPCSPCFSRKCSHISCLRLLSPDTVANLIQIE